MKRIALLLFCGALAGSAQEFRLSRAVLLKSERSIVSLRAGTIVDLLSRDKLTLTVRFNQHTGVIPANSLTPGATSNQAESSFSVSAKKTCSPSVNAANKPEENATSRSQNNAKQVVGILAVN